MLHTTLAAIIKRACSGLVLLGGLSCAPSLPHQDPPKGAAQRDFYVFTTEGKDSATLWKKHADEAKVIKDYDALELTTVTVSEDLLKQLKAQGEIEFYVPMRVQNPQVHEFDAFDSVEADGTKANVGKGADWYWDRIHGDTFIKNGVDGDGIVLVVLDTGIGNPQHDLIRNNLEKWYDWVNYRNKPYDDTAAGGLSHGLACAGEVTRSLPKVKVHMHKIHRPPNGDNYLEDILEAYDQVIKDKKDDKRPYVLSQSYGLETLQEFQGLGWEEADAIFSEAEERLWKSSDQIYLTSAAGNDASFPRKNGRPTKYPAQSERVISAGAYRSDNEIAFFSSLGGTVYAPGMFVRLAAPNGGNDAMTSNHGTSFAGPLAAADVVGILSYCSKHDIPVKRADLYAWVPEWTDRETSKVHYSDGGKERVMVVDMRQVDFENTYAGLEELRKALKK